MTKLHPFTGDALFQPCPDGGDLTFRNGEPLRSGGLAAAVYISITGGNDDDPGGNDTSQSWWGNLLETDPTIHIRGRTAYLLRTLPLTTGNIARIQDAALEDTQWIIERGVAASVDVTVSITSPRRVQLSFDVRSPQGGETFVFALNWTPD